MTYLRHQLEIVRKAWYAIQTDPSGCNSTDDDNDWYVELFPPKDECKEKYEYGQNLNYEEMGDCLIPLGSGCDEDVMQCGCYYAGLFEEEYENFMETLAKARKSYLDKTLFNFLGTSDPQSSKIQDIPEHQHCLDMIATVNQHAEYFNVLYELSDSLDLDRVTPTDFILFAEKAYHDLYQTPSTMTTFLEQVCYYINRHFKISSYILISI